MKGLVNLFNGNAELTSDTGRELKLPALTHQMFPLLEEPSLIGGLLPPIWFQWQNSLELSWLWVTSETEIL